MAWITQVEQPSRQSTTNSLREALQAALNEHEKLLDKNDFKTGVSDEDFCAGDSSVES